MRLFFGVPLDEEARGRIGEWTARWKREFPEIRWTGEELLHVTLVFLGEVPDAELDEVGRRTDEALAGILDEAGGAPASFSLSRPGCFLHPRRVVLWLGAEDPGWIAKTARSVGRELSSLSPDAARDIERPFTAHVTLARARVPWRRRAEFDHFLDRFAAATPPDVGPQAARIVLFRSDLKSDRAMYTPLRSWGPWGSVCS